MSIKKWFLLLIIPLLFTGCINYTELNELGIVESMGIEKQQQNFLVSINMIDARSENDDREELRTTYTATGASINEALENLYLNSNKKIYLSHIKTLLLSTEVAKSDGSLIIDFFLQTKASRNNFTTIIVKDTTPSEIIRNTPKNPDLEDMIQINSEEYGITSNITFEDFARMVLEEGQDAVLPTIKVEEDTLEIDGYAYFQDAVFQAFLSKEESLTYNIIKNNNTYLNLYHSCAEDQTSIKLEELKTTMHLKEDQLLLQVTGNFHVLENNCALDATEIKETFQEQLKTNIKHLLEEQRAHQVDILGLSAYLFKNHYAYYQKHQEAIKNDFPYEIKVNLHDQKNRNIERIHSDE